MPDYIDPTQERFNEAETVVKDVLETSCPSAVDKMGSVIRELVVRPLSYLYAWILGNTDSYRQESSVAYLKTSSSTDNPVADLVASNYFVTRKEGTHAKGVISIVVSESFVRLPLGARLTISDVSVVLPAQYILTTAIPSAQVPDVEYILLSPWTPRIDGDQIINQWIGYVPVEAEDYGHLEIPPGAPVTAQFPSAFVQQVELVSALSGGSGVETDAEMMARCEYSTASSGIGSYYGLKKKLDNAPVNVSSLSVVAGEDDYMYRGRYNAVNINPGGFVDCYVKTRDQESRKEFSSDTSDITFTRDDATVNENSGIDNDTIAYDYHITVPDTVCPGFYAVIGIRYVHGDESVTPERYTVREFTGDRLSGSQGALIDFRAEAESIDAVFVTLAYMDGISEIQRYMDLEDNTFIGQDVMIKAAVPVPLSVECAVSSGQDLTESELTLLKETMVDYVNSLPVGTATLNFSDIRSVCAKALPEASLRLPCTIVGSCYTYSGLIDTWFSSTGILNIADNVNEDCFNHRICFFSLAATNIRIEQL